MFVAALALAGTACGAAPIRATRIVLPTATPPRPVVDGTPANPLSSPAPTASPVAVLRAPARPGVRRTAAVPTGPIVALIRHHLDPDPDRAVIVFYCESSHNASSDTNPPHIGVAQINWRIHGWRVGVLFDGLTVPEARAQHGKRGDGPRGQEWRRRLYDAEVNLRVARMIFDESKWVPWSCKPGSSGYAKAARRLAA